MASGAFGHWVEPWGIGGAMGYRWCHAVSVVPWGIGWCHGASGGAMGHRVVPWGIGWCHGASGGAMGHRVVSWGIGGAMGHRVVSSAVLGCVKGHCRKVSRSKSG